MHEDRFRRLTVRRKISRTTTIQYGGNKVKSGKRNGRKTEKENVGEINASSEVVLAACFNGERVENWPRKQKPSRWVESGAAFFRLATLKGNFNTFGWFFKRTSRQDRPRLPLAEPRYSLDFEHLRFCAPFAYRVSAFLSLHRVRCSISARP